MDNNVDLSAQYFIASLSHELRTPLNGIVGYTQLLMDTKMDKTQKTYLNSLNSCCLNLVELINDILDYSKLSTGKMPINNSCYAIAELFEDIKKTIEYKFREKNQSLYFVTSDQVPEFVISDRPKIMQILINLLSNANKYTQINGRVIVRASIMNDKLVFSVEDNGCGIDSSHQGKLFDEFYQVNQSTTKSGSGLGLAISKKLVNLLGGQISVESEVGSGSIFTFTVTYERYEDFQSKVESNTAILKNKYILIVDDKLDNRLFLSNILHKCGMIPIMSSSGIEALHILENNSMPFSIILLDICMPDMSGSELAGQIKETYPELPLIALSSSDDIMTTHNFELVLHKPVNKIRLLDCLIRIIGRNDIHNCLLQDNPVVDENAAAKKHARILIAEDIDFNRHVIEKLLENCGYKNVEFAVNGQIAIDMIEKSILEDNPYDILLLDLVMPVLDGFGVIKHIRDKKYSYPKIAILTASVSETDKDRCRKEKIKYFLVKPVSKQSLSSVLKHLSSETMPRGDHS